MLEVKNIQKKYYKKIMAFIIILTSILSIQIVSAAVTVTTSVDSIKNYNHGSKMPQNSLSGSSGMFPQYYRGARTVTLDDSRLDWKTNKWQATMNGSVVYCADYKAYVRYGKYDVNNKHWLFPSGTTIQSATIIPEGESVESQGNHIYSVLHKQYYEKAKKENYYSWISSDGRNATQASGTSADRYGDNLIYSIEGPKEAIGYIVNFIKEGATKEKIKADAQSHSMTNMQKLLEKLGHHIWPSKYSTSIDDQNYNKETSITAVEGPEVVVMEQNSSGTAGYAENAGTKYSNNSKAFIFSASEDAYDIEREYAREYSLNDIQGAFWLALVDEPETSEPVMTPTEHVTENAKILYEKSKEYANFAGNFSASINTSEAQVIADRDNKQYIVGPYSINYTDIEDISYMKSITINDSENLIYDETHKGIELILCGKGTMVPGSNGLETEFPTSGQRFFIKFSAEKAGYPTNVTLNVRFEYISKTQATVDTKLKAEANIYKYWGYSLIDDTEHNMSTGSITFKYSYPVGKSREYTDYLDSWHQEYINGEWKDVQDTEEYTYYWNETVSGSFTFDVYMPYIMMEEDYNVGDAQELSVIGDASREYTIAKRNIVIDLSMELGGYAFEDNDGGKEDTSDGTYGSGDKKISNMPVTLYLYDGTEMASTKTNENGEYRFSGLNAMYQYYVKFTYNGQYYQPTTYSSSNTWGGENWQVNSNAKDRVSERESYNIKFEKIGSSPANYEAKGYKGVGIAGYNKTYTRLDLLGYTLQENGEYAKTKEAVIDEFGNLTGKGDESRIQYVKDCMMNAYTNADASAPEGLYPVPSRFLIADGYKWALTPKLLASHGIGGISILYPTAYYINLGLDSRQQSDLAVKKDIEKVTLEINGQTHTYTYDTLENKENAENEWDINVRLSDAYYSANYSREIYKADYIYKASMYGDTDKNGDGIGDTFGKSSKDELEVYVTYKIMVRNQAMSIQTRVDELVDYYDQDLEYIDERSYIEIKRGDNQGKYAVKENTASRYGKNTQTTINGYDNLYVTGLDDKYLTAGQTAYIYLTFKVKKDSLDGENWVKLDEDLESAVAIGVGKENIAEINGYSTRYASGTQVPNIGDVSFKPAGIVDHDSNPGNVGEIPGIKKDLDFNTTEGKKIAKQFEDDTDKAPNIRIILDRTDNNTRTISGSVWEDTRNNTIDLTTIGDGERTDKETLINGVTIQLVEIMENGTEYVWREFGDKGYSLEEFKKLNPEEQVVGLGGTNTIGKGTGSGTISSETPIINYKNLIPNYEFSGTHDGQYAFKSFMPGKYVVRFIYGDTVRTVTPESLKMGGLNAKSYNGQDYKSTIYQKDIAQENKYIWTEKATWNLGEEILGKVLTEVTSYDKVNADYNERTSVPTLDASGNLDTTKQKGYYYDITASDAKTNVSDAKDIGSIREAVNQYSNNYGNGVTNYLAEVLASHKSDYTTMNDRNILLEDLMENTKMTSETGLMVIELEYDRKASDGKEKDFTYKIQNVDLGLEERPKAQLAIDKKVTNVKLTLADGSVLFDAKDTAQNVLWRKHEIYQTGYNTKTYMLDESKFASILNIREKNKSKFGLIQLSMDEELMHGATIKITYEITITNVGEVDYKDNRFYYTGKKSENAQIVTTRADQVIDYVANNLQFNASENSNWSVIQKDKLITKNIKQDLVNSDLKKVVDTYNTIIQTEKLNKDLVPSVYSKNEKDYSTSVPLVLTQLITSENDTDDLTYSNIVEIVKTSNMLGRKNEYSVVGNQDATTLPQELDSDEAEVVKILPPFGNTLSYIQIAVIAIGAVGIIVIGIIFIKKKVLIK